MDFAVDTSTVLAYFLDQPGDDIKKFELALQTQNVALPPFVLVESLSNHRTRDRMYEAMHGWTLLALSDGFWLRASELRANVLKHGHKARMADTLIAQCCIDNGVKLITRDADFRHFAKHGKLKLA